ncbi:non-ribosomal peptide synthetase [Streptomyces sp. WMMC1477]|uniref:non-ribosomal peptide synthetase n=1 Tax=Streptomyces sp. WMMC1477 TaxID=3015155 RepID=UPI0022B697A3|nr:non-ribosomal peptide synthetase [Streptomyces sp. WMMC1477]MCZ7434493.1 amino acid adenylation domain-containing protein [Streptomyces sp. WMMC1477]
MTIEQPGGTHRGPGPGTPAPPEEAEEDYYVLPTSFAQRRLWFLSQLAPASAAAYLGHGAARLRGPLDTALLQRSADTLVRRHETLRTSFAEQDGEPVQLVHTSGRLPVAVTDLSSTAEPEAALRKLLEDEVSRPFRLDTAPLARVVVYRLAPEDHVLVVTFHHGIGDMWSGAVLVRELAACYTAHADGAEPHLPELPVQYGDYAAWQRERLDSGELLGQIAYWRRRLADLPVLELACDRPRPPVQSFRGAVRTAELPARLVRELGELGRQRGASLFMVLLAGFSVLLSRYSGQRDIPVGSPVAGRDRPELEHLIGVFINNLVLRTDVSGDPAFSELVDRARETCLEAYAHPDVPFERLVEELRPPRDLSRGALVQVMLMLGNTPRDDLRMPGLEAETVRIDPGTAKLDLFLTFLPETDASGEDGGLRVELEYSTDLFDAATADRMLAHLRTLLEAAAAGPHRRLSELPALPADELRLLEDWGTGETAPVREVLLHDMVREQTARDGGRTAVFLDESRLTYTELDERANRLAHHLRRLGVRPGDRVAVFTERTPDLLVALLGVLRSGGAYVPVDPDYPSERIRYLLADSEARLLVAHTGLTARLPEHDVRLVLLDGEKDRAAIAAESAEYPETVGGPEDLAYVIYTSGSTGRPKGVMVPHGRLPNLLDSMRREPGLSEHDIVAATITHAFDMSVLDFFLPLSTGAAIALIPRADAVDGDRLAARMDATGATYWQATPAAWQLLLDTGWRARGRFRGLCGAEPLSAELARRMSRAGVEVWQVYGPTETTVWAACHRYAEGENPVPLGRPLPNTRFRVLGPDGRPAPLGVPGELTIGGPGVARGYHGKPELTERHFVADPRGADRYGRVYRTGDLVRYRPDGVLEFVGRADSQVKVRGFRVELGEIAAVLREHRAVRDAVVLVREDTPGDRRLVGYAVPEHAPDDVGVLAEELREAARERLPDYMVPAAVVVLPEFPRTPNGKVDRAALPVPGAASRDRTRSFTEPRTETERRVAAVWAEVLGRESVGAHDDFFTLGGHSLLAARAVGRLGKERGRKIPVRLLFDHRTVAELADVLDGPAAAGAEPGAGPEALPRRPEADGPHRGHHLLPASAGQKRLWFLHRLDPDSARAYLMPGRVELDGPLDADVLREAVDLLVRRHETLRTALVEVDGELFQAVAPAARVPVEVLDLTALPEDKRAAEREDVLREAASTPFDLGRPPLVRVTLLRTAPERHVLSVVFHHSVCDRWSVAVFVRELVAAYGALREGAEPDLPHLPVQYGDHAAWQRDRLDGPEAAGQLAHWRERLRGLPALDLPTDRPRPAVQTFRGARRTKELPTELVRALEEAGRRGDATLFMVLLAAFTVLLSRYGGQKDVAVGSPVAGRDRPELEHLIGFFVNTLVLRTDLEGDPAFTELLARVRRTCLDAYAHADVPFERLVDEVGTSRDLSRTPLVQAVLSFGNIDIPEVRMGGADVRPLDVSPGTSKFDLVLEVVPRGGTWQATLEYNTDLFDAATADRLLDHLGEILDAVAAEPGRRLSELPATRAADRADLERWGRGPRRPLPEVPAHVLFEERVREHPDATALVCPDGEIGYGRLNARANRLARRLRALGVGPGTLVALCAHRSADTYTGILGVLKAGGAYVPVDPGYPPERVRFMLADSAAPVLLTQQDVRERLGDLPGTPHRHVVLLDRDHRDDPRPGDEDGADLEPLARPDDLAYVIYTSGSTGRPKGAMVTHRGVAGLHLSRDLIPAGPDDRVLAFASTSFDASVWEWTMALLGGGALVLPPADDAAAGLGVVDTVRDHNVTVALLPPSLLAHLDPADTPSLRTVVSGGEDCSAAVAARWAPHVRLVNAYGPTEAAVYATLSGALTGDRHPPLGRPVPNARLSVTDADGRPVPVGATGELRIGGAGVGRGYLGRPELTAERFLPDPWHPDDPARRVYRTGDLVRYLPTGELEYLGRQDAQTKIRGFRIEPGEVEAVLRGHRSVGDVLVAVREDPPGDRALVAYVVPHPSAAPADAAGEARLAGELRALAREHLPAYMVPAHLVLLAAFPLTPSGKVDRTALPAPVAGGTVADEGHVAPANPTEERLCALFTRVLGAERVGVHDDFFALGGNSLSLSRLHALVRDTWPEARVPLRLLFERPTPRAVAEAVGGGADGHHAPDPAVDVTLDPAVRVTGDWTWNGDPRVILLTGATGFLGAFLLRALLETTSARVLCLVRAESPEHASARLEEHLRGLGLWDGRARARARALPGDFSRPALGLGQEAFAELAADVDEIHHCGASVNFGQPYAALREANVGGVREILRLACTGRVKPVHHVSTLSVFSLRGEGDPLAYEDELPAVPPSADNGYNQSKWVAEKIVALARERGVPVSVYRPGRIAGDSASGAWRTDDVFCHVLRACAVIGSVPELAFSTDIVPVDHIAAVIARAARGREHLGGTYQFAGAERLGFDTVVEALDRAGHPVRRLPYDAWYETCRRHAEAHPGSGLGPTLSLFGKRVEDDRNGLREPVFDTTNTRRASGGLRPARVDAALLERYLRALTASGFLPPPSPKGTA